MGRFTRAVRELIPGLKVQNKTNLSILQAIARGTTSADANRALRRAYQENPTAFSAIFKIASAGMAVPWTTVQVQSDGTREEVPPDHPVRDLLRDPSPVHSWDFIVWHVLGSLALHGDAYLFLNGPSRGGPREIWPIPSKWVKDRKRNALTQETQAFEVTIQGGIEQIPAENMVHTFLWSPDDPWNGQPMLKASARSLVLGNEARKWNSNLLRNTARPPGTVETEAELTDAQYQRLKGEIEEKYRGSENAGIPILLEGGASWEQSGLSPGEMEWLQGVLESKRDIAGAMGLAPEVLGDPEVKTYANARTARVAMYEDVVFPFLGFFRESLRAHLRNWWPSIGFTLEKEEVPALRERQRQRAEATARLVEHGIITRNEARERLGYEELDGADDLLVPMNLIPVAGAADTGDEEGGPGDEESVESELPWEDGNGHGG